MPEDIRTVPADHYWDHAETVWTGLLGHRGLGRRPGGLDRDGGRRTMALRHDMGKRAGGIMAAPRCGFSTGSKPSGVSPGLSSRPVG